MSTKFNNLGISGMVLVTLLHTFPLQSQDISFQGYEDFFTQPLGYVVYKSVDSLVMDGKATELSWQQAAWSDYFVDIEGNKQPKPPLKTRFKMVWSQQALFVYVELEEPHIWATLKQHDAIIFKDNDFEIFIDPDGDTHNYFEIEVNALATVFDLFLPKAYRNLGLALIPWDARDLKVAVSLDGSMNNPEDIDIKWSVEMAIPFRGISLGKYGQAPVDGSRWRINFSRVEWDVAIAKKAYQKKINPATNKPYPEHNWVWSPQGLVNMHYPERWGYALFSSQDVGSAQVVFQFTAEEQMKKYLWLVYYKQAAYRRDNNHYAASLHALSVPTGQFLVEGKPCLLSMESTSSQFVANVQQNETGEVWQITHEGFVCKKSRVEK